MASPPVPSRAEPVGRETGRPASRRANWWALGVGTVILAISYLLYGVATADPLRVEWGRAALSALVALAGFVAIARVSGRDEAWKRAMQAGAVLVLVALPLGLLARLPAAAVGLGIGVVITLNPPRFADVFRNRLVAVALIVAYALLLFLVLPPAGVMTGAFGPPLAAGLADEFSAWRAAKRA